MENSIFNSPASGTQTRPNPSQWYIQSKYSQTNDKCWTIDTAFLDKKLGKVYLKWTCADFFVFTKILQDSKLIKIAKVVFFLICKDV
jgi:hypothetical protein